MTANPSIFGTDRAITHLPYVMRWDYQTNTYTAWYTDFPGLVVQAKDKMQITERLRDVLMLYLKRICKTESR